MRRKETNLATTILRSMVRTMGSQLAVAKKLRISPQYLNDMVRGRTAVSARIARKLGLERRVVYVLKKSAAK